MYISIQTPNSESVSITKLSYAYISGATDLKLALFLDATALSKWKLLFRCPYIYELDTKPLFASMLQHDLLNADVIVLRAVR